MKGVILVAGVGKRLAMVTRHQPKCLLEFGGRSLLVRYLDALLDAGIKTVVLVVGHKQELIRAAIGESYRGLALQYVSNDQHHRGSLYSLWLARATFDDDLLIMDGDVLCPGSFVRRLLHSPFPNALLIDETVRQHSEERMVVVRSGRVVALTKNLTPLTVPSPRGTHCSTDAMGHREGKGEADLIGEGVGFLKVTRRDSESMLASMEPFVTRGELDMEYDDTWKDFFRPVVVGYEKVGGEPWIEIDFPEDIERANREILPRLPS